MRRRFENRVFLKPEWLVNVMKELVRHDLEQRVERIDHSAVDNAEDIQELGRKFVRDGELHRQLLPWLWRDLQPPVVDDDEQMDFLVELMVERGLLTRKPRSKPPCWLLPLRLPLVENDIGSQELAHRSQRMPSEFDGDLDEVGFLHEFHQAVPAGLMAEVISSCAQIDRDGSRIWQDALSIIFDKTGGTKMQVLLCKDGLSRIDLRARCEAGQHHQELLRRICRIEDTMLKVIQAKWSGCTAAVSCTVPFAAEKVPRSTCQQALNRGEHQMPIGGKMVKLTELLAGPAPTIDPRVRMQATSLRFFRDLEGVLSELSDPKVDELCSAMDQKLLSEIGTTSWSQPLQHSSYDHLSEHVLHAEVQGADAAHPNVLVLLRTFGELYERWEELCPSLRALCDHLLTPFPWLETTLISQLDTRGLSAYPGIASVLADRDVSGQHPLGRVDENPKRNYAVVPWAERKHDVFINHCQASGQDQCNTLAIQLKAAGASVWYDMQAQDLTAKGMEEGVSQSRCVLMFLSDDLMGRPFCHAEQRWGKLYGCGFVGVVEKDSRHCPADFGKEEERAPADLKHLFKDVEFVPYDRRGYQFKALIEELLRRFKRARPLVDLSATSTAVTVTEGTPPPSQRLAPSPARITTVVGLRTVLSGECFEPEPEPEPEPELEPEPV